MNRAVRQSNNNTVCSGGFPGFSEEIAPESGHRSAEKTLTPS
jgi:hypothetical protein